MMKVLAVLVSCCVALTVASVHAEDGKIVVACVGDSITFGAGTKKPATDSYPAQLAGLLGEKFDVKNFGVSGSTLLKNGDFEKMLRQVDEPFKSIY